MARTQLSTTTDGSVLYQRRPAVKTHRYQWPGIQLNIWILVMLVAACFIIGAFSIFIQQQQQLLLPVPWFVLPPLPHLVSHSPIYLFVTPRGICLLTVGLFFRYFPYFITVSALTVTYIILLLWLVFNRRLLPAIVMIGAFMLFVLWMVGLVVVAIQLFGPSGSVQGSCDIAVFSFSPKGQSLQTLAWLQQRSICKLQPSFNPFLSIVVVLDLRRDGPSEAKRDQH